MKVTLNKHQIGKHAIRILQYKVSKGGFEFKPEDFAMRVTKITRRVGCSREEALAFFQKFILPHILLGCELKVEQVKDEPSEIEATIARKILEYDYFSTISGLRNEAARLSERTGIPFNEVAAIARYIAQKRLNEEFEKGVELEIVA